MLVAGSGSINKCPLNWFYYAKEDICITHTAKENNFTDTRASCQNLGGDLVVISTEDKNKFIFDNIVDPEDENAWIGLKDDRIQQPYLGHIWVPTGNVLATHEYSNWDAGYPRSDKDDCVIIHWKKGKWRDKNCRSFMYGLCQKG